MSIQSGIKGSGTEGSESFSNYRLKNQGRNFVARLLGELRPLLITDAWTEGGTVEVLLCSSGPFDPDQLDTSVVGQGFDVITHLLHVLPNEPRNLSRTRFAFIENLECADSNRMLNHKDDELIDGS
jgi:hypothetical protein